jgi:hypothetical protein
LTRHEFQQLCAVFGELSLAVSKLGDMVIAASREMIREDEVNTALEQQQPGADHGDERSL